MMVHDCIFCKIANGEVKTDFVYENNNFVAFLDANPLVEGHTLIIPKKHFVNILDLHASLGTELIEIIKNVASIRLKEGFEGFNILQNNGEVAGQEVMHAHFHFIPRKKGDGKNIHLGN